MHFNDIEVIRLINNQQELSFHINCHNSKGQSIIPIIHHILNTKQQFWDIQTKNTTRHNCNPKVLKTLWVQSSNRRV